MQSYALARSDAPAGRRAAALETLLEGRITLDRYIAYVMTSVRSALPAMYMGYWSTAVARLRRTCSRPG